jgi:acetyl esterase/lipase
MMQGWAQEKEKEETLEDILSKVSIDTIQIKATPYEKVLVNGVWKDEEKQIDYYNDITIYEISKKETGQPSAMMTGPKPAIFMLPGGGFFQHTPEDISGQTSLGVRLVNEYDAICYIIKYQLPTNTDTLNLIKNSVIVRNRGTNVASNCNDVQNETGKARLEEASYKAFHDLRRLLRIEYANKATQRGIDTNRFVLIGSSSGSVLALNTLFLQASEIPQTITFNKACPTGSSLVTIEIKDSVRNGYWPIPKIKGIVSMAGAWIYDSTLLVNNTPTSVYRTPIFLMHGTCDNLINRRVARIGFKRETPLFNPPQNLYPASRFIKGYGSEYIFNQFRNTHDSLLYGQVWRGGHAPFLDVGGWDKKNIGPNDNTLMNQLLPFLNNVIEDNLSLETKAYSFNPLNNYFCADFDQPNDTICFQKIYNPNPTYTTPLCDNSNKTAVVEYIHPDAVYTWSVNSGANISIEGSNVGTSIQYKRIANINKIDTLIVTITRPCAVTTTYKYVVESKMPSASFTPTISPAGWNTICSTNKTATLLGIPSGTPSPDWTESGNIEIVTTSGNSVTYKRKNNLLLF